MLYSNIEFRRVPDPHSTTKSRVVHAYAQSPLHLSYFQCQPRFWESNINTAPFWNKFICLSNRVFYNFIEFWRVPDPDSTTKSGVVHAYAQNPLHLSYFQCQPRFWESDINTAPFWNLSTWAIECFEILSSSDECLTQTALQKAGCCMPMLKSHCIWVIFNANPGFGSQI